MGLGSAGGHAPWRLSRSRAGVEHGSRASRRRSFPLSDEMARRAAGVSACRSSRSPRDGARQADHRGTSPRRAPGCSSRRLVGGTGPRADRGADPEHAAGVDIDAPARQTSHCRAAAHMKAVRHRPGEGGSSRDGAARYDEAPPLAAERPAPRVGGTNSQREYVFEVGANVAAMLGSGVLIGDGGTVTIPRSSEPRPADDLPAPPPSPPRVTSSPRWAKGKWVNVNAAADLLGFGVVSFRRLLERHARRAPDGGIEAVLDGVRARKIGRTWRVQLSSRWTSGPPPTRR